MKAHIALTAFTLSALAACSSSPTASADAPATSEAPAMATTTTPPMLADSCKADAAKSFVGKAATPEIIEQARVAANAKTARVLTPNMMVTMEYRGDRLNLRVSAANVIGSVDCG